MKIHNYTWPFVGTVCCVGVLAIAAALRPEPAAMAQPEPAAVTKPPTFGDLIEGGAYTFKTDRLPKAANIDPPPAPVTSPPTPAPEPVQEPATPPAPQAPTPCEIAIRRLAFATTAPVRESILDDIEAKYEAGRINANQRFVAIRFACVKGHDRPRRGMAVKQ